jgi:hypothetical protein
MVRSAALADLEQICLMDPSIQSDPAGRERLQKAIGRRGCLVSEQDGRLAGYGCMDYRFFERGFVSLVYVSIPQRQRRRGEQTFRCLRGAVPEHPNLHLDEPLQISRCRRFSLLANTF